MTSEQGQNRKIDNQLKILSLNVCGLITKSNYPEFIELIQNYDIIGIQESKTDDCDFVNIPGYNVYLNNREKMSRRRSGGIALLVRKELQKFVIVESHPTSKLVLWCTILRNFTQTENDVYCGVVYIPPIGSKYANDDPYSELQGEILRYCTGSSQ